MRVVLLFLVLVIVVLVAYILVPVEQMQLRAKDTIGQAQSLHTSLDFDTVVDGFDSLFERQEYVLNEGGEVVCTDDAMLCPDGSAVGRIGPDCAFAPCSGEGELPYVVCTDDAMLCPDGSAVGRIGPDCAFAPCSGEEVVCTDDAMLCPDGSVVGRIGPDCAFAPCS